LQASKSNSRFKTCFYEYEFNTPIDIITGDEAIRKGLESGRDLDKMEKSWQEEVEGFLAIRKQYLLY
jgi:uncharacterized protein YbbC (DUF1343 family)